MKVVLGDREDNWRESRLYRSFYLEPFGLVDSLRSCPDLELEVLEID